MCTVALDFCLRNCLISCSFCSNTTSHLSYDALQLGLLCLVKLLLRSHQLHAEVGLAQLLRHSLTFLLLQQNGCFLAGDKLHLLAQVRSDLL